MRCYDISWPGNPQKDHGGNFLIYLIRRSVVKISYYKDSSCQYLTYVRYYILRTAPRWGRKVCSKTKTREEILTFGGALHWIKTLQCFIRYISQRVIDKNKNQRMKKCKRAQDNMEDGSISYHRMIALLTISKNGSPTWQQAWY